MSSGRSVTSDHVGDAGRGQWLAPRRDRANLEEAMKVKKLIRELERSAGHRFVGRDYRDVLKLCRWARKQRKKQRRGRR